VVCDENGFGGSSEYCGDSDAHLGSIYVFYHEALRRLSQSILEILKTITIVFVFKISKMDCDTDT
jgi:hypothetical protein